MSAAIAGAARRKQLRLVHNSSDPTYASDIRKIKTGKAAVGMTDDEEDAMILSVSKGRTDRASQLTAAERLEVLRRLKPLGFVTAHRVDPLSVTLMPRLRKMRAIWYALSDVQAVNRPAHTDACDQAIAAYAKRMIKLQSLAVMTVEDADRLIEYLKAWAQRVEAPTNPSYPPKSAAA